MRWSAQQYREFTMKDKFKPKKKERMNKLERRFMEEHPHLKMRFESIKLRLADRTWYTPDFSMFEENFPNLGIKRMQFIEVKGFWRDDARVKIKVAAEMYPEFGFAAVTWKNGKWDWELF